MVCEHILLKQCCLAIEIQLKSNVMLMQRRALGNGCVRKSLRITFAQSACRRYLVTNEAMDRMVAIIQIQSVVCGLLVRKELVRDAKTTTEMKTCDQSFTIRFCAKCCCAHFQCWWRSCDCNMHLLSYLAAVGSVQSVFRRWKAMARVGIVWAIRRNKAATAIETRWETHDCTMDSVHYLAKKVGTTCEIRITKAAV